MVKSVVAIDWPRVRFAAGAYLDLLLVVLAPFALPVPDSLVLFLVNLNSDTILCGEEGRKGTGK